MSSPCFNAFPRPVGAPLAGARQARFWNRIARRYADAAIADLAGYERTLDCVSALLSPEHVVLEIGCGTGATALRLAPAVGRWLATDVSPAMIDIARDRLAAQSTPGLDFAVADADAMAFDAAAHDRVLAFNVLHLVSDLERVLTGVAHTLRAGGLFIAKTPCIAEMNPLLALAGVPVMRALGLAPPLLRLDESRLCAALRRAGLEVIAIERHGTRGRDARPFIVARKPG